MEKEQENSKDQTWDPPEAQQSEALSCRDPPGASEVEQDADG